jgi:ferrous iron transport protein B
VERKLGHLRLHSGQQVTVVDLPGTYSLIPATPDEQVTLDVIEGRRAGEDVPEIVVAVVDATNLRMNLRLVLELKRLGKPMMVAVNMADVAQAQGLHIDLARLSEELACPVVETVAVKHDGHANLTAQLEQLFAAPAASLLDERSAAHARTASSAELQREVRRILALVAPQVPVRSRFQHNLDRVVMHPVAGLLILAAVLFLIFKRCFPGPPGPWI